MAMRGRYDVLRSSRTTWVICECVLLQTGNQRAKKSIKDFFQGKCRSEINPDCLVDSRQRAKKPINQGCLIGPTRRRADLTSRSRWSAHSSSWPPSPGRLGTNREMSNQEPAREGETVTGGVPGVACRCWVSSGTKPPP